MNLNVFKIFKKQAENIIYVTKISIIFYAKLLFTEYSYNIFAKHINAVYIIYHISHSLLTKCIF